MSRASRKLQVGARVVTDFDKRCLGVVYTITGRKEGQVSGSGILFTVEPMIPTGYQKHIWFDADWFVPVRTP